MQSLTKKNYLRIVAHYESCLTKYGDSHLGVDWPNKGDAETRYKVMLDVIQDDTPSKKSLLDFGCGASHLYEYIQKNQIRDLEYSGLDLSEKFISLSRQKFPLNVYYYFDILNDSAALPEFDYVIMNGVFTEKISLSFDEMFRYFQNVILAIFSKTRVGIAFNVMSKHVDWERKDLFHLPFEMLAEFLTRKVSKKFIIRNDYGLYEYTTYVYR